MRALVSFALVGTLAGGSLAAPKADSNEFHAPRRLTAAGKPIDTAVGHAAPCVADFDGDGKRDLLVGQFGNGILWIHKNTGTNEKPVFAEGVKFQGDSPDGRVPTG